MSAGNPTGYGSGELASSSSADAAVVTSPPPVDSGTDVAYNNNNAPAAAALPSHHGTNDAIHGSPRQQQQQHQPLQQHPRTRNHNLYQHSAAGAGGFVPESGLVGQFPMPHSSSGGYDILNNSHNGGFQQSPNGGFVQAPHGGGYMPSSPSINEGYGMPQQQPSLHHSSGGGGFVMPPPPPPPHSVLGFMPLPPGSYPTSQQGFSPEQQQPQDLGQHRRPMMIFHRQQSAPMSMISVDHGGMMIHALEGHQRDSISPMMGESLQQPLQNQTMATGPDPQLQQSQMGLVNSNHSQASSSTTPARPGTIRRSMTVASSTPLNKQCRECGVDVNAASMEMETARRRLALLQEQVEVDQALLLQEKKNFKRRLQAVKASVKKTQLSAAAKERQRQMDWAELRNHAEKATRETMRDQQGAYEMKLLRAETTAARHGLEQTAAIEALQEQILRMDGELAIAHAARREQAAVVSQLHERLQTAAPSAAQQMRIEQLERSLEDRRLETESLEMQLLELERERDTSGGGGGGGGGLLRGSGGTVAAAAAESSCHQCQSLHRQISDAQVHIDTLQNRQGVTDQKLSQERLKYEALRGKMDQMEVNVTADREQNDSRLRMAKDMKDLQQQLNETRIREQETVQHRKTIEQKLVQMQQENEALEEKVEEVQKSNDALQSQLQDEKTRVDVVVAMAAASQRAVEDSAATQVVDVLSCIPSEEAPLSPGYDADVAPLPADDVNRRYVMEYEWHGTQWTGVYTGQVSTSTNNPDGDGTLRVDDGAVYNGAWRDGQPHGAGVWATIEGDLYCSASWHHGAKHGRTVDVLCDGCVYRGDYVHGQRHGYGVLTWPYGAHYAGHFVHDKRNGEGQYCYADGRCYTGTYRDDRPHGYGVLKAAADGAIIYDGMWQLGEFIGTAAAATTTTHS